MSPAVTITPATEQQDLDQVFAIRQAVFIDEQGFTEEEEWDGHDKTSDHIKICLGEQVIGCARIRWIEKEIRIERIALLKEFRGQGFGRQVLPELIAYAKAKNPEAIFIHAQNHLKKFYEGFGFEQRGEVYDECGIPHIHMYLS